MVIDTIHKEENLFMVELDRRQFKTRIALNWSPDDDFRGLAVCCNYHSYGRAWGLLRDNGLWMRDSAGFLGRPIFTIETTQIQAGPTLVLDGEKTPCKVSKNEKFRGEEVKSGLHVHIGKKRNGNILVGMSNGLTLDEIKTLYINAVAVEAIKLPGHDKAGFYYRSGSRTRTVIAGTFPCPAALIFETRPQKGGELLSDITHPL